MQASAIAAIEEAFSGSQEGLLHFGQVIGTLVQAGVESYHVDYRACRSTYYLPDGETHTMVMHKPEVEIGQGFNAAAIVAAIRAAQAGEVMYPEFKRRSQVAGCVSYTVWITGRHVTYYGREGETHIEKFPD